MLPIAAAAAKRIVLVVKGSKVSSDSKDWELLRAEWRRAIAGAASNAGMTFSYQESAPQPSAEVATLVTVNVNDYRYVSPGARYGFGVMTGNAFIDADVSFAELPSGKLVGTRKYNTSSTAWQGIFSAMTEKQIQAISAEIVKEVSR